MVGTQSGARRRSTTAMLFCANGSHRAGWSEWIAMLSRTAIARTSS
jgi:hypothetical protein